MRIPFSLGIESTGIYLPQNRVLAEAMVDAKVITEERFKKIQAQSIYQEDKMTASEMAFHAASDALKNAGVPPEDLSLIIFSSTLLKDYSSWSAAADLCNRLSANSAEFLDIYQGCNGVMSSIDLAVSKMFLNPEIKYALIVSAEKFPAAVADRWNCDPACFYGDGAGAFLLKRNSSFCQIQSFNSYFAPELNDFISMGYGSFSDISENFSHGPYSPRTTKRKLIEKLGKDKIEECFDRGSVQVFKNSLKDCGLLEDSKIDYGLIPNYDLELSGLIASQVNLPLEKTSWEFGRKVGHVGCVDPILNFHFAKEANKFKSGQRVFILSHGAGVSVMGMMVSV